ncbi:glucosamine-6-phosphate deaminase [Maribacter sp. ANRC-HE7]|uniref:Glucosamine-6-phosphate deaminase n=2 Tax=Maribacter aquimaris TaxID=2737171 RepID=A0ABR7V0D7_9FLAO|nr:glucosamine-6-phosphate deaminase [Maribacter aquimaris]
MIKETVYGKLKVQFHQDKRDAGRMMAQLVALRIIKLLDNKETINMIFAAAPSQLEFLDSLLLHDEIPWERINAFHMDEYVGLDKKDASSFSSFLSQHIFDRVPFKKVHLINGKNASPKMECDIYSYLLHKNPPDIVCMGIGENAHIAFNDPHVADFKDSETVKVVDLDNDCRNQQVNDGCFTSINDVPKFALTLTIPCLMKAPHIFCIVPGKTKAKAIYHTLLSPIGEKYPATCLREHMDATLFLDQESSSLIDGN